MCDCNISEVINIPLRVHFLVKLRKDVKIDSVKKLSENWNLGDSPDLHPFQILDDDDDVEYETYRVRDLYQVVLPLSKFHFIKQEIVVSFIVFGTEKSKNDEIYKDRVNLFVLNLILNHLYVPPDCTFLWVSHLVILVCPL